MCGGLVGGGSPVGGQGGCERTVEVIVKMQKKVGGGGGLGVWVRSGWDEGGGGQGKGWLEVRLGVGVM